MFNLGTLLSFYSSFSWPNNHTARQKFHNFHGQLAARLECGQSVYDNRLKRSPAISLISILLFSSPDVHLRSLNKTFVDGVMNKAIWDKYIEKLRHEWQAITLYVGVPSDFNTWKFADKIFQATFLLAVNVAFLAIQSVDVNRESYRSAAQIFSYLSAISSIGSIAQSLIIIRNSWENIRGDAVRLTVFLLHHFFFNTIPIQMTFLYSRQHYENGLEMLAIRFSLPHALIMWGWVIFSLEPLCIITLTWYVGYLRLLQHSGWCASITRTCWLWWWLAHFRWSLFLSSSGVSPWHGNSQRPVCR